MVVAGSLGWLIASEYHLRAAHQEQFSHQFSVIKLFKLIPTVDYILLHFSGVYHFFAECDKSEIAGNPHVYKQYVAGHGHYTMPCAPGTVFVQDKCTCETGKTVIVKERSKFTCTIFFRVKHVIVKEYHRMYLGK